MKTSNVIPIPRFLLFMTATFGLYFIVWLGRNWTHIRKELKLDLSPAWRTVGILFVPLLNMIWLGQLFYWQRNMLRKKKVDMMAPGFLVFGVIVPGGFGFLPDPFWLLAYLFIWPLVDVQRALNEYWAKKEPNNTVKPLSWPVKILCTLGCLFTVLNAYEVIRYANY